MPVVVLGAVILVIQSGTIQVHQGIRQKGKIRELHLILGRPGAFARIPSLDPQVHPGNIHKLLRQRQPVITVDPVSVQFRRVAAVRQFPENIRPIGLCIISDPYGDFKPVRPRVIRVCRILRVQGIPVPDILDRRAVEVEGYLRNVIQRFIIPAAVPHPRLALSVQRIADMCGHVTPDIAGLGVPPERLRAVQHDIHR